MTSSAAVLVVGGGPTGLIMAAELARHGVGVRLIDVRTPSRDASRAAAIQARTLEIFSQIGVAGPFLAAGNQIAAANFVSGGRRLARLSFEGISSPFPFVLSLQQDVTEALLADHAKQWGVSTETGVELISFAETATGIEAVLLHHASGVREQFLCRWLVGADGAHSRVRKLLNIPFSGVSFADIFSLADLHLEWKKTPCGGPTCALQRGSLHNEVFAFLNAQGVLAAIPLPEPNRYRLVFQLPRCRDRLRSAPSLPTGQVAASMIPEPTLKEVQALLDLSTGEAVRAYDPVWMAHFHVNSRIARAYRCGRAFLAGDAAHIHSPVGGQGMNTGIQDAYNLAWKLALVDRGQAPDCWLDTYAIERGTVGRRLLAATERASRVVTLHSPIALWIRNQAVRWLARIPVLRRALPKILSQTAIRYPRNLLVQDEIPFCSGPRPGTRAPNAPVIDRGRLTDLYSIWRGTTGFHLIACNQATVPKVSCPILVLNDQTDPDGSARARYSARRASRLYLIRPDGYIGWRGARCSAQLKWIEEFLQFV